MRSLQREQRAEIGRRGHPSSDVYLAQNQTTKGRVHYSAVGFLTRGLPLDSAFLIQRNRLFYMMQMWVFFLNENWV
jgi:hypothetical protein